MARRVNTKFLTILTVVVVGLGMLALIANKVLIRESPEKYVSAGTQFMADKKYEEAVKAYARAVGLDQKNPSLWVAYGDALNQMSSQDVGYMGRARQAWDQALAVEPGNMPALDRMMQFWSDIANMSPNSPDVFKQLQQTAERLYAADPKNSAAEIAIQTSIIRPWLAGVEKDEKTIIIPAISRLETLMKRYPENPDLPMFAAQGKLRLAERDRQRDQNDDANKLVREADQIMQDAVKRQPTAAMYFSAAQVAQAQETLANFAPKNLTASTQPAPKTAAEWRTQRQALYAKARELAKADDPLFVFINIAAARATADKPEAEKILRELNTKVPDDQQVRLELAAQLATDPTKRPEAIAILDKPFASNTMKGPRAFMIREMQIRTMIMATNLRLDQYAGMTSAKKEDKDKLLAKIQESLAMIETKDGVESARPLRLRGKLLKLQGETIAAIQTLEKARSIADKNKDAVETQSDRLDRWEVIDLLARSYIETQQTGRAKSLLQELVNKFPGYEPGRMLLASVLIKEGATEEARPHVDYLVERRPTDPEVIKLKLQVLDPKGLANGGKIDPTQQKTLLKETYVKLPETNKQEVLDKVQSAMALDMQDDAIRLLDKAKTEWPGDYDTARMGLRVYRYMGELDRAKEIVETAAKANPKDEKLQVLLRQVQDLTPAGLQKVMEEELAKNPDPIAKAAGMANLARQRNQPELELKYLQDLLRLKPGDGDVQALMFKYYLRQRQFDKAELMLEPLTASNQDQAGGLLFRYQLDMTRGDYPKALDDAQRLVQRMGEFGQSWLALGQALQANGMNDEALSKFLTAVERQSDSPDALRGVIESYYALSRPSEAKRFIDRARRALPNNAEFKEMEIQYDTNYGDPEKTIAPREEAAKKSPDKPNAVLQLGQAYLASARSRLAKPVDREKMPKEMFDKAKATFKGGIAKWPDEIAFYAYYAEASARSGELGDSEAVLKQLAARDAWKGKQEPEALLAEFYAVSRRPADSEAAFRELVKKDPANTDVQVRLANLLASQNKVDEALAILQTNIQDPKVSRRRVEILVASDRGDEADKVIEEALGKSPSNLDLLHLGAGVDINHGRFDRAAKRLARATEIDAANPTTHYYIGLMKVKQPNPDLNAALEELTKGKDSPTMGTEARFALADVQRKKNNPEGALRELESALSNQPGNMRIRLGLLDSYLNSQPPRWVDAERVIKDAKALPGYAPNPDLLEREATMWMSRNDQAKALAAMQEARTMNPGDMGIARKYLSMLLKQTKYPQVNQEVEALIAKDKNLWWALEARAESRRFQGNKDDSIKDFEAALSIANAQRDDNAAGYIVQRMGDIIGPDEVIQRIRQRAEKDDRYKLMIARLQATKGDNDSAIKTVEQVLANQENLQPADRENTLRFGAMLYLVVNNADKSSKLYEQLLKVSPDDLISLNNMACLLAETTQPPRPQDGLPYAKHAYDLMQQSRRKDAVVMDTYGWLLVLCNKLDEGLDILRAANDIRQLPDIHYHLGYGYMMKGFADQAQQELDLAKDMVDREMKGKPQADPSMVQMKQKIEAALGKVDVLRRNKGAKSTANAPIGTNVP